MTQMITRFTGHDRFLSNFDVPPWQFAMMDLGYGGEFCRSGEHAFQAHKAPRGSAEEAYILAAPTPLAAKNLGRKLVLPDWWEQRKKQIMLEVLLAKFSQPDYRRMLAVTEDMVLVEGNTWGDDFWGACPVPLHWQGEGLPVWQPGGHAASWLAGHNWLGRLLMMVREIQS